MTPLRLRAATAAGRLLRRASGRAERTGAAAAATTGPLLVYQMGKVGSRAVVEALRASPHLHRPVHHFHLLNDLDEIEQAVRTTHAGDISQTLESIAYGRRIRQRLLDRPDENVDVVSLVRDPVRRNLSAFVQSFPQMVPEAYERFGRGELLRDEILGLFIDSFDHSAPLMWFDRQVREVFGIDVFEKPFDWEAGFTIYTRDSVRLMVIRLEDLDRCVGPALEGFLGLTGVRVSRANETGATEHSRLYHELEAAGMPMSYLDSMYGSRFARHFYSADELAKLTAGWTVRRP